MSNWTSAAFGMPAMNPATAGALARASQPSKQPAVACGIAAHGYAKRLDVIPAAVRAGADLTVDAPGARAWSPPV